MNVPAPTPGLVVSYSYLWRDEALRGAEEGRKDRPCVVILTVDSSEGACVVTVAPITHSPPAQANEATVLPLKTKARLGLDDQPSWIMANDLNQFTWPGVDMRPVRRGADRCDYGILPTNLLLEVKDRVVAVIEAGKFRITRRSE